jgi:prophage maintenance system killer protein
MNDQENPITLYQTDDGRISLEVRLEAETVWLTQDQMRALFGRERSVITKHLRNVFKEGELDENSVCANFAHTAADGKTYQVKHYNLDVVISIGYRVKSQQGTRFRQWATRVLRQHLLRGYTLNEARFAQNAAELEQALSLIRKAARSTAVTAASGSGLVEIISRYTQTFLWLQRYDEGLLTDPEGQPGGTLPTEKEARDALTALKQTLIGRGEATHLFALDRDNGLKAILGNLDQTVFGEPAYPTLESKAAHLLYFMVKDHPFADGNKRSAALLFVDFMARNGRLFNRKGEPVINDSGLVALTLLVAESDPKQKETMIRLIMNILAPEHKGGL